MLKRFFVVVAALCVSVFSAQVAYGAQEESYDGEEFVTTVNLRLRSGPSTDYSIMSLLHTGTVITVTTHNPATDENPDAFSAVIFGEID